MGRPRTTWLATIDDDPAPELWSPHGVEEGKGQGGLATIVVSTATLYQEYATKKKKDSRIHHNICLHEIWYEICKTGATYGTNDAQYACALAATNLA